ncbi:hypothetical protein, partial [Gemmiger sp.]|uniref:hypothetical protein n=1 Tax=Gemmiger sp. TaxID=2049027 RepID=UPI003AB69BEE
PLQKFGSFVSLTGELEARNQLFSHLDKRVYPTCYVDNFSSPCGKRTPVFVENLAAMLVFHLFNRVFNKGKVGFPLRFV